MIPSLLRRAVAWRVFYALTSFLARLLLSALLLLCALSLIQTILPSPVWFQRALWLMAAATVLWFSPFSLGRGGLLPSTLLLLSKNIRPRDRLLNVLELSRALPPDDVFLRKESAALAEDLPKLNPPRLLRPAGWGKDVLRALLAAAALASLWSPAPESLRFALRRAAWPWAGDAAWLSVEPGSARVPAGENVSVRVAPRRPGGGPPSLFVRGEKGGWRPHPVSPDGRAVLERVTEKLSYRARHRGLWSGTYVLTPYLPLRFASVRFRVHPPAYTGLPPEDSVDVLSLRAPEGARVEASAVLDRPARAARVQGPAGPVPAVLDGKNLSFAFDARRSGAWRVHLESPEGDRTEIPLLVDAVPDQPPSVLIHSPEGEITASPSSTTSPTTTASRTPPS